PIAYDVILGKPWLDAMNPDIDWKTNTMLFYDDYDIEHIWNVQDDGPLWGYPELSATQFKKVSKNPDNEIWLCVIKDLAVKHLKEDLSFKERVDQVMEGQPPYLCKVLEDHEVVFSGVHGMPPACPTDHKIELIPGAIPPTQCTYHMSE